MKNASYWIHRLGLKKHPEGGYYAENYRATETIPPEALPERFRGVRAFSTAIYYLLEGDDFSSFHRILSDELWHFYGGSSLVIHCLNPDTSYSAIRLGNDPERNEFLQAVIPAGTWFAAEAADVSSYTLAGCTVAPGFDFNDFSLGTREELIPLFPGNAELIRKLTRG